MDKTDYQKSLSYAKFQVIKKALNTISACAISHTVSCFLELRNSIATKAFE
ncbi:hypothetical protein [Wolbachia endosymbiont (group B) of Apotomis betuletana]|uniref:hypothetical protein n=1 Tax=Wolbachia endosymbiont (group B) of Apotomis betuletana TaxID=2953982 RepID=UPI0022266B24|nr:hypothetical protein [Wolbachia endosymbiont (group B) of Apotomis betuletana]